MTWQGQNLCCLPVFKIIAHWMREGEPILRIIVQAQLNVYLLTTSDKFSETLAICTLRSEIITQLSPQKLYRAIVTQASRNLAWIILQKYFGAMAEMDIAQIDSWKHAAKTVRKLRATTKLRNRPNNHSQKLFFAIDCDKFAQSLRKCFSKIISSEQCFLNGGYDDMAYMQSSKSKTRRLQHPIRRVKKMTVTSLYKTLHALEHIASTRKDSPNQSQFVRAW